MGKVVVTKILIEYLSDGKKFSVDLKPTEIGSIVLTQKDLQRAQGMQLAIDGAPINGSTFSADAPVSEGPATFTVLGSGTDPDAAAREDDESLWWHSRQCDWTHPE